MKIEKVNINSGILAKDCVQEFQGKHFVVSDGDIVIFDGQSITSIADRRVRAEIFLRIDDDNFRNSYVARYDRRDEMWFCYPTTGQVWANRAAVWNWKDDTWQFRDLRDARHIASGLTLQPALTYDQATFTYDSVEAMVSYAPLSKNPTTDTLVATSPDILVNELSPDVGFDDASQWVLGNGATISGSQCVLPQFGAAIINAPSVFPPATDYELVIVISAFTGVGTGILIGGDNVATVSVSGTYIISSTTPTTSAIALQVAGGSSATVESMSLKQTTRNSLNIVDETFDFDGQTMTSSIEKLTMDFGNDAVKIVKSIAPRITADVGTTVYIRVGTQMNPDDAITYSSDVAYIVGVDRKSDFTVKGRYISVRFRTIDPMTNWRIHGFHVDIAQSGQY